MSIVKGLDKDYGNSPYLVLLLTFKKILPD